jgi:hypothetical protein
MNTKFLIPASALALLVASASVAHASDLNVFFGANNSASPTVSTLFNLDSPVSTSNTSTLSLTGTGAGSNTQSATLSLSNAAFVNGSSSGQYAVPIGSTGNYLSVYNGGSATFDFTQPEHYFGLLWGSVDSYNSISFLDNGVQVGKTITGSDIANLVSTLSLGSQTSNGTVYANFTDSAAFNQVVLQSTGNSFEFDNVQVAVTPLPGAALMFCSALLVLAGYARRRAIQRVA